jgi:hypothetical protein
MNTDRWPWTLLYQCGAAAGCIAAMCKHFQEHQTPVSPVMFVAGMYTAHVVMLVQQELKKHAAKKPKVKSRMFE